MSYTDCDACDWVDIGVGMQMIRPDHFCRVKRHRIDAYAYYNELRGEELEKAVEEGWPPFWDPDIVSVDE